LLDSEIIYIPMIIEHNGMSQLETYRPMRHLYNTPSTRNFSNYLTSCRRAASRFKPLEAAKTGSIFLSNASKFPKQH